MSELKPLPCPFCDSNEVSDGEVLTEHEGVTYTQSECQECGALGPRGHLSPGEVDYGCVKAIEAWNRRAQPAQAGQVLTLDEVRESVHEAGLDWHNGWTMGEDAENRYLNLCRAIEQAVLAKRVPQWRDIETAPKDGSIFLCWVTAERYGETDEGQQYTQDVSQADFGWWRPGDDAGYFDCGCGQIADRQHISHWMPLPPPPGIVGEKGGA